MSRSGAHAALTGITISAVHSVVMTSAFATGLATIHSNDTILDVWFPDPKLSDDVRESGTEFPDKVPAELHPLTHIDAARETRRRPTGCI